MNPQSDPTPGLRLPQPSMNPGAAQPFMALAQSPEQPPAVYPEGQAVVPQPLHSSPAQSGISAAQAQVVTAMQTAEPIGPMVNPGVSPQASQSVQQRVEPTQPHIPAEPVQPTPAVAPPADENDDSVDEQWVEKAKTTINQYKTDPYMQSKAFSRLKAEYMQTRHNKTLKVDE